MEKTIRLNSIKECEGTGFNKTLKKYKINDKSVLDIWKMTLDEGARYFEEINPQIARTLYEASTIMLGHLRIGQSISSLSGGENIRIKILEASRTKKNVIGIDEPFRGLSNSEIMKVLEYLEAIRAKGKTIVVADHSEYAAKYFLAKIQIENINGKLIGKNL